MCMKMLGFVSYLTIRIHSLVTAACIYFWPNFCYIEVSHNLPELTCARLDEKSGRRMRGQVSSSVFFGLQQASN